MSCSSNAASVAEAAGIPIYGGMALESSIGTAAALQLFSALPLLSWDCELIGPLLLADDLAVQPTQYHNFEVVVPHGTGLGVEPDTDKEIGRESCRERVCQSV